MRSKVVELVEIAGKGGGSAMEHHWHRDTFVSYIWIIR